MRGGKEGKVWRGVQKGERGVFQWHNSMGVH